MRVFLEEMVLDLPDVIDADPVGEFDLLKRVAIEPLLGVFFPRLRQLVLIEKPELHRLPPLCAALPLASRFPRE